MHIRSCLLCVRALTIALALLLTSGKLNAQMLKSVVYDFDGLDLGQSSLPEGDYSYGDLAYEVAANPLSASGQLGDRVLKLSLEWNAGYGALGRGVSRFLELNRQSDRLNFYVYNPPQNNQTLYAEVILGDDDNNNKSYLASEDDIWKKEISIPASPAWQLISVPLAQLSDGNTGGNGQFDIGFSATKGALLQVELKFLKKQAGAPNATFYIDMIAFSEGLLPRGTTELDLPYASPSDHCYLGAYHPVPGGQHQLTPQIIHGYFPSVPGKKIVYVNTFLQWAVNSSTVPNNYPGSAIQSLISSGYVPLITWEPVFKGLPLLDPAQPNLDKINSGIYDAYIDSMAARVKLYSDTVIIRLMHEFDGNWYPWSVSQNGGQPQKYIDAFKRIVQRFRDKGANNVKWMWSPNSDFAPNEAYNWVVNAYPGSAYVDIVAASVYNAHYPAALPWWRSFRWQTAEIYYYLTKYFPDKPFFIAELGVRERTSAEPTGSQTKGAWFAQMDKELQSHFRKTRALIFFDQNASQSWAMNTSTAAIDALTTHIWNDNYYFPQGPVTSVDKNEYGSGLYVYPNPSTGMVTVSFTSTEKFDSFQLVIFNSEGRKIFSDELPGSSEFERTLDLHQLSKGIYLAEIRLRKGNMEEKQQRKLVLL